MDLDVQPYLVSTLRALICLRLLLQSVQMVNTPTTRSCFSSFRCHVLPCGTSTSARVSLRRLTLIGFLLTCADGRSCSHVHRLAAGPVRQHSVDYTGQARCAANFTSTTSTDKNIRTRTRTLNLSVIHLYKKLWKKSGYRHILPPAEITV